MRKANSSSTYREFRKKSLTTQPTLNDSFRLQQIDQLSRQLDTMGTKKTKMQQQCQSTHSIIEEVDEQDINYCVKDKINRESELKLSKMLNTKSKNAQKKNKNFEGSNKTLEISSSMKSFSVKAETSSRLSVRPIGQPKQPSLTTRRMSLTGGYGKSQIISIKTNASSTKQNQKYVDNHQKKQLLMQVQRISKTINRKLIPQEQFEILRDNIGAILSLLNTIK